MVTNHVKYSFYKFIFISYFMRLLEQKKEKCNDITDCRFISAWGTSGLLQRVSKSLLISSIYVSRLKFLCCLTQGKRAKNTVLLQLHPIFLFSFLSLLKIIIQLQCKIVKTINFKCKENCNVIIYRHLETSACVRT